MKYTYNGVELLVEPQEFSKDCPKEVLQYAVGGLLYMPATNSSIAGKIISGEYEFVKSLVLDLEDALGDELVEYGQSRIVEIIDTLAEAVESGKLRYEDIPLIFIRVREKQQILDTYNMLGGNIRYITGFNIPKFDKHCSNEYIEVFKIIARMAKENYGCTLYIMPIIENKSVMYRQLRMDNLLYINDSLNSISDNVLNIRVGGADFNNIFGIRRNTNHTIYDTGVVRSCLNDIINVFGSHYVVSGPVWEYFGTEAAVTGLKHELDADQINGFFGKTCIHPSQLPIVQEFSIIDKNDYLDALSILGMNSNIIGVQKSVSGRMNEVKTHSNWAKKIVSIANLYGVRK
jgi:citrate lyase beta subunit